MPEKTNEIWSGLAVEYEQFRPDVPEKLIGLLAGFSAPRVPDLVVDLGSGTGKSSRAWHGKAKCIVGIEPSEEMIAVARKETHCTEIRYEHARAEKTGLPDHCADYIVASSALHWMEPEATLKEVKRILKPGGIFAFWGTAMPPISPFLDLDQDYFDLIRALEKDHLEANPPPRWTWEEILGCIRRNEYFRIHRYFHLEQPFRWNAVDYLNWLGTTLPGNYRREEAAYAALLRGFRKQVLEVLGNEKHPVFFNYTVHVFKS